MPFYLHRVNESPDSGDAFETKADAIKLMAKGLTITCIANNREIDRWTQREADRFFSGVYTPLPWFVASEMRDFDPHNSCPRQYTSILNGESEIETVFKHYGYDELKAYRERARFHYAHLSMQSDGMIAYTPNDMFGMEDRQTKVRAGKYLELVAPFLKPEHRDELCAQVKAHANAEFQIATSADDIVNVYKYGTGFTSCMDARNFDDTPTNPVRVYGESDLAVAYLGKINDPDTVTIDKPVSRCEYPDCSCRSQLPETEVTSVNRVTARCVIWPEKKIYTRVYGDPILTWLLKNKGYTHGTLDGAKVRRIQYGNSSRHSVVMPYVDGADYVQFIEGNDAYLQLSDSHRRGSYECKETCGRLSLSHLIECSECGGEFRSNDEDASICGSCEDNYYTCDACDNGYYTDDAVSHTTVRSRSVTLCESCDNELRFSCDRCDDCYYEDQYTVEQSSANERCDEHLCPSCLDEWIDEDRKAAEDGTQETLPLTDETPAVVSDMHTGETESETPVYTRMAFCDIPMGSTIRVIAIPHHTGVKIDHRAIRWNPCPEAGNDHPLCHCPVRSTHAISNITRDIPYSQIYEVIS